jgi:hypothetical protein
MRRPRCLVLKAHTVFILVGIALGCLDAVAQTAASSTVDSTPALPVGWDAYRMWDHWPDQRIGARAYMRSTSDRSGGNDDAGNFLFQTSDTASVPLDIEGAGVLYFSRFNHWHGSPWHYIIDGADHVIQETTTADPNHPLAQASFLPEGLLPTPLDFTYQTTKGADLIWNAISFQSSLRIAYERTHYGTGYFIYDQFVPGVRLSSPLSSWDGQTPPPQDVLDLLAKAGSDLLPAADSPEAEKMGLTETREQAALPVQGARTLATPDNRAGVVRAIGFTVPAGDALAFGRARLRITWDGCAQPSVDAPVALFFGAGTLYNREKTEFLVKALPTHIRFHDQVVDLACYFPMPFFKSARIELIGNGETPIRQFTYRIRETPLRESPDQVGYFHATYRDHGVPAPGEDLVLLDTRGTEGSADWSGSFIGTSFIFSDRANLNTLEGDPRFSFDDSQTPQAQGTGTEEWGGGGDYWGGKNMTLPFAGHPTGAQNPAKAQNNEDKIESAYRFLLADMMPFGRNAIIHLEHGGTDDSTEHYRTVTYWYGLPAASLVRTDRLQIGDPASEHAHHYYSPNASAPYAITSLYDAGVDTFKGKVVYPPTTDQGRKTTGTSEFMLKIDPKNRGVMLRRKLDYQFPNQRAEIFVANVEKTQNRPPAWKPAGIWYTAGSTTWVSSNPGPELGPTQHHVHTSNRRFRDDEFLLPLNLTTGRSAIRVRVKFTPVHRSLYPRAPEPELTWSEIRYDAYSYIKPDFKMSAPTLPH